MKDYGYKVWLDIEQMEGSTLEASILNVKEQVKISFTLRSVAGAIEHADMVLICMSQRYKDSPNCRLEGEYCINRGVPFVPLMMQKSYKPDGWYYI